MPVGVRALCASLTGVGFYCMRRPRGLTAPHIHLEEAPSLLLHHCRCVVASHLPTPHLIYQVTAHFIDGETEVWRNNVAWPGPLPF